MAALFAAAVDGIVGEVLEGVQGLAAAADDGAHARAGQLYQQPAVVTVAYLNLRLDAHAVQQAAQKALSSRLDALGILGLGIYCGFFSLTLSALGLLLPALSGGLGLCGL